MPLSEQLSESSGVFSEQLSQESPRQTKPKQGQFMNFLQGHSGTKVRCESCLFSQAKTPEFTKMGEIHELFVLALSLVWFAGATLDSRNSESDSRNVKFQSRNDISRLEQYENHTSRYLGATLGAIPQIDGNPHENLTFAPAFSVVNFTAGGGEGVQPLKAKPGPTTQSIRTAHLPKTP